MCSKVVLKNLVVFALFLNAGVVIYTGWNNRYFHKKHTATTKPFKGHFSVKVWASQLSMSIILALLGQSIFLEIETFRYFLIYFPLFYGFLIAYQFRFFVKVSNHFFSKLCPIIITFSCAERQLSSKFPNFHAILLWYIWHSALTHCRLLFMFCLISRLFRIQCTFFIVIQHKNFACKLNPISFKL